MGLFFTVIIALIIFAFTVFQIKRLLNEFKSGKCATCSQKNTCQLNQKTCGIELDMNDVKLPK